MPSAFTVEVDGSSSLRALNYSPLQEVFRRPRAGRSSFSLGEVYSSDESAYGSICTRNDCDISHGVEFLSQTDMFATEPAGRVIRIDSMSKPERHEVKRWQILIAGVGTLGETELYGRSIIADDRLVGKFVTEDAFTLTPKTAGSTDSLYTYAFLCAEAGISLIRSVSFGTKMLHLRKSAIPTLCIPDAPLSIKEQVAKLIRTAVEGRGQYLCELQAARSVINSLEESQQALSLCNDRKARFSVATGPFVTISARNHASLGAARMILDNQWKTRLVEHLVPEGIFKGPRTPRVPCRAPHGIQFFDQRDIFGIRPIPRRILKPAIPDRELYVPRHALLVASRGQFSEGSLFGSIESAWFGLHRHGITEDILRIIPRAENHEFLYSFLSSRIGFLLLKSTAVGTSIPMMHPELISRLPCPSPSDSQRSLISQHVQKAMTLREMSDDAEAEAIRIIEQEVLPPWLA